MGANAEKKGHAAHSFSEAFVAVEETPDKKATLIGIRGLEQRFTFAIYFGESKDKEGYRQLAPFFRLAEELRLYRALIEGIDDSSLRKFDFVKADLDWAGGHAKIVLLPHGDKNEDQKISISLLRTLDTFSMEQESMKSQRRVTG
ncbi:MAG: hypothetical protein KGI04_03000 [Candidatus Micrarchaeota archaeon]|nr:hypothetical protein [Candidatus Micrarchaeota archaeon]